MPRDIRRILVITGDHSMPDPTKRESGYHEEDFATHRAMEQAFGSLDPWEFEVVNHHDGLLERLRDDPPDMVVNFCDTGFRNVPTLELHVPAYLELHGIPYTGASPQTIAIIFDKEICRLVAQAHGVPVPQETNLGADPRPEAFPDLYPALIKPNTGDGSVGISKDAVVRSRDEAADYVAWVREQLPGRDVLWQEYLPGPEYGVGAIGNADADMHIFPALEVDFSALPAGLDPILSFESKTEPDSPYWTDIGYHRARMDPALEARMGEWVKVLFRRLNLRDYARCDFRCAADGLPRLMEVNCNPAWACDAKLAMMAGFEGIEYRDMLRMLLETAIARINRAS